MTAVTESMIENEFLRICNLYAIKKSNWILNWTALKSTKSVLLVKYLPVG